MESLNTKLKHIQITGLESHIPSFKVGHKDLAEGNKKDCIAYDIVKYIAT